MKVATVVPHAHPLYGGAQLSVLALLFRLRAEHGIDGVILTSTARPVKSSLRGVPIRGYRDLDELKQRTAAERPDVVLGVVDAVAEAERVAASLGLPTIAYLQSFELCPPTDDEVEAWGVSKVRSYWTPDECERILRAADRVFANSPFLRDRLGSRSCVAVDVLYPEFLPDDFLLPAPPRGRAITAVAGHRYKGSDVLRELARAFPDERFVVVGDADPACRTELERLPNVALPGRRAPRSFLRASKIVLMPSLWPEPFGRVAVEAMANGIPTLASATGGLAAVAGEEHGVTDFADPHAWVERVGELLESKEARARLGESGPDRVAPWLRGESSAQLALAVRELATRMPARADTRRTVAVRGATKRKTAFSVVNASWCERFEASGRVRCDRAETAEDLARIAPDVTIHHDYAEHFATVPAPDAGFFVAVRTWDFGPFPRAWVERIEAECDQLWVHSRWVREQAIAGGVAPSRVAVVPLGVDERVFTPEGPAFPLRTRKSFRFLFVGAPVVRKGFDVLLEAYCRAFGPDDDVCLVVKDNASDVFYSTDNLRERIAERVKDPTAPEIESIDDYLPSDRLAALYRSCRVGVFPYRAEGFCMPILEAMACGVPSIVPRFGAALDFCSTATSLPIPVRRIQLPVGGVFAFNSLGFTEQVDEVDFCEVAVDTLVEHLRLARALPAARLERLSREGAKRARARHRWQDSAERALALVGALRGVPRRLRRTRSHAETRAAQRDAARELYLEFLGGTPRTT